MTNIKSGFMLTCTKCDDERFVEKMPSDWLYSEELEMCLCPDCSSEFRGVVLLYANNPLAWSNFKVEAMSSAFRP